MQEQKEFGQKLATIRNRTAIEIKRWWGLGSIGYNGKIVTQNREIYSYQYYYTMPKELEDKNVNFISKDKDLNSEEYKKIINFIENEIANKEFHEEKILDAGFEVIVNYEEIQKDIKNNVKIYDKTRLLIDELLK